MAKTIKKTKNDSRKNKLAKAFFVAIFYFKAMPHFLERYLLIVSISSVFKALSKTKTSPTYPFNEKIEEVLIAPHPPTISASEDNICELVFNV